MFYSAFLVLLASLVLLYFNFTHLNSSVEQSLSDSSSPSPFDRLLEKYIKLQNSSYDRCSPDTKYVVFKVPGQGWGNRIRVLASAFLWALYTERLFLVDWAFPVHHNVLLTPPFNWDFQEYTARCNPAFKNSAGESFLFNSRGEWIGANKKEDTWVKLETADLDSGFPQQTIEVTGWVAFISALLSNPHYSNSSRIIRDQHPNTLGLLLKLLVRPSPEVATVVEKTKKKLGDSFSIGLQMRLGTVENPFPNPVHLHLPQNLVSQQYVFGKSASLSKPDQNTPNLASRMALDFFFHCADLFLKQNENLKIFVATDNRTALLQAREKFKEKIVVIAGEIKHSGLIERDQSKESMIKVVGEWFVLGEVDLLYRTYWSTFGYTAMSRGFSERRTIVIPNHFSRDCPKIVSSNEYETEYTNSW